MDKTLIAMSGGVDSSVAAYLVQQQGFPCIGGTMLLWNNRNTDPAFDARQIADRLGMDFYVFDHQSDFRQKVVEEFVSAYESGYTPNPCVNCNRYLKFDILLQQALALGCSHIATGHYAQVCQDPSTGRYLLYKAADLSKDQTYFLACLNQHQLSHCRFPLGGYFMQIDVADGEILRRAQEHPEEYRTLSVRVSGWNARFITLDRHWQDMVIAQNEKQ